MTAMGVRAYAKHRGVAPRTVGRWKLLGRILVRPDGLIEKEQSDAMLDARPHTYRGGTIGGTPAGGGTNPHSAATRRAIAEKEHYIALTRKLEYERAADRLVDVSLVRGSVGEDYAIVRKRLMRVSSAVVPLIMVLPVPRNAEECKQIIDREVIRALEELSADAVEEEARAQAGVADA
jgi:hypothetical protein